MSASTFDQNLVAAKRAVVRVGKGGRGFIVGAGEDRYIITAAHCLPIDQLPIPQLGTDSKTFPNVMAGLAAKRLTIWGHLCEFGLTNDLAVFCEPDIGHGEGHYMQFEKFTKQAMPVGLSPDAVSSHLWAQYPGHAALTLSLAGEWQRCIVHNGGRFLSLDNDAKIVSGMSGSPIINEKGAAIGVISTGSNGLGNNVNPSLSDCLSPWLFRKFDKLS